MFNAAMLSVRKPGATMQDYINSYKWFTILGMRGYPGAAENRAMITKYMPYNAIQYAEGLARAWRPPATNDENTMDMDSGMKKSKTAKSISSSMPDRSPKPGMTRSGAAPFYYEPSMAGMGNMGMMPQGQGMNNSMGGMMMPPPAPGQQPMGMMPQPGMGNMGMGMGMNNPAMMPPPQPGMAMSPPAMPPMGAPQMAQPMANPSAWPWPQQNAAPTAAQPPSTSYPEINQRERDMMMN